MKRRENDETLRSPIAKNHKSHFSWNNSKSPAMRGEEERINHGYFVNCETYKCLCSKPQLSQSLVVQPHAYGENNNR